MNELEAIEVLISAYAPAALIYFIGAKGLAAWINNNVSTVNWPKPLRKTLDWLASANKKAKDTGEMEADQAIRKVLIKEAAKAGPKTKAVAKLLNLFS